MAASPSTRAEVAIEAAGSLTDILGLTLGSPHGQGPDAQATRDLVSSLF